MIGVFRRSSERTAVSWEIGMVGFAMAIEKVVYLSWGSSLHTNDTEHGEISKL